jgi:arylsulfatase A-like enzyme
MLLGGTAVQAVCRVSRRIERFHRLVQATLPWMAAACVGTAIGLPAWWTWSENRAIAALPKAAQGRQNILLIVWDTVRAKSLGTYGYDRDTSPNLTALGKSGIVFQRAVAPCSWTLPSHASFFTGRWADELSASWNVPLDDTYPTLAEVLNARGYVTAGFVANQFNCSHVRGLRRGFLHYEDFSDLGTEFVLSCEIGRHLTESTRFRRLMGWNDFWGRKSAEAVGRDFLHWLDKQPDRPFFAFLSYFDAHQRYYAPPPFDGKFGPRQWREDTAFDAHPRHSSLATPDALTPRQRQAEQNAYDGSIAYMDACLGHLLDELNRRGLLDNTLVIVTSDHGEQFGEHGLCEHGNSLYRPVLHVPLVIRTPGGAPSELQVEQVVSLRDLPATIVDLVGLGDRVEFPGRSLRRYWDGTETEIAQTTPVYAHLQFGDDREKCLVAVIADGLHYVRFIDGHEELFDFFQDPLEARDLSSEPDMQSSFSRLRALVSRHLRQPAVRSEYATGG